MQFSSFAFIISRASLFALAPVLGPPVASLSTLFFLPFFSLGSFSLPFFATEGYLLFRLLEVGLTSFPVAKA